MRRRKHKGLHPLKKAARNMGRMAMYRAGPMYDTCLAATMGCGLGGLLGTLLGVPLTCMGIALSLIKPRAVAGEYFLEAGSLAFKLGIIGWAGALAAGILCRKIRAKENRLSEVKL